MERGSARAAAERYEQSPIATLLEVVGVDEDIGNEAVEHAARLLDHTIGVGRRAADRVADTTNALDLAFIDQVDRQHGLDNRHLQEHLTAAQRRSAALLNLQRAE